MENYQEEAWRMEDSCCGGLDKPRIEPSGRLAGRRAWRNLLEVWSRRELFFF